MVQESMSPGWTGSYFLPLQEGVGLTQATTKLLLLPWVDFVWVPYKSGL